MRISFRLRLVDERQACRFSGIGSDPDPKHDASRFNSADGPWLLCQTEGGRSGRHHCLSARGAAACNEAIAKQPVPQQAGRLYSCAGETSEKRQEVLAGMIDAVTKPKTRVKTKTKTERPRLHKVILINDDFTPREFVVTVLKAEFRMTEDQAHKVMITAHRLGVCVVAVFTKDVAETKATRATDAGRAKGYPLLFTTEPEE